MDNVMKESGIDDYSVVNNAIVFFGADHKVGTTLVCKMIGERVSQNKGIKTVILCLDGTPGTNYVKADRNIKGIDDYKAKMSNNILSPLDFANIYRENEGLYFIKGSESIIKSRYYYPSDIYNFLNTLSTLFDILIIDAGSNIELGMTIGALKVARKVILITDQSERSFERFMCIKSEITSKLNIEISSMIINKYLNYREFQESEALAENYQCDVVGQIFYSEFGLYAELEKSSLLDFKNNKLIESIDSISKNIESFLGISWVLEEKEKRTGIKKYLVKKGWI